MRTGDISGLVLAMLLLSGCFQAEAPRHLAQSAGQPATDNSLSGIRSGVEADEDEATPAVTDLAAVLREGEDPASRQEAVYQLADAGIEADAGFVGQALADPDPAVRRAAVEALTGFEPGTAVSYLALALNDTDPRVRLDAVEALGNFGSADARRALEQGLIDGDERVRVAAAQMLEEPERR